jgi:hypothetical protein
MWERAQAQLYGIPLNNVGALVGSIWNCAQATPSDVMNRGIDQSTIGIMGEHSVTVIGIYGNSVSYWDEQNQKYDTKPLSLFQRFYNVGCP